MMRHRTETRLHDSVSSKLAHEASSGTQVRKHNRISNTAQSLETLTGSRSPDSWIVCFSALIDLILL